MIIRSVGIWSVARLYGAITASVGLIFGLIFAIAATVGGFAGALNAPVSARGQSLAFSGLSAMFGVGALIFMPIVYGIMGLIGGAIGAGLYNLFAEMLGGIEVEVQQ